MASTSPSTAPQRSVEVVRQEQIVVRFCGDSGDGMQLAGTQLTNTSAAFGNDVSTLPDFPAEIRAPAGTLAGVSGFQLNFSSQSLLTPGDLVHALIAMNPAALKTNLEDLEKGGILIVNSDAFNAGNLQKAGYAVNPLEDGSLADYKLYKVPMDKLNADAVEGTGLTGRQVGRSKNFFALGVVYWLYDRPLDPTITWIKDKFSKVPAVMEANIRVLKAGHAFGETTEMFPVRFVVPKADVPPGLYRKVTGNQAMAIGLVTAAKLANKPLFYGSYPITPASDILHELARYKNFDVRTFQAEDEIAAMTSVVGAAYTGAFAVTGTSGPGVALKAEAIGLAIMTELPMVIVNVQRGGPSTGLPTKTEQADLNQAIFGRNGESPLCVLAPATPAECFDMAIEAFRIATQYMMPVIVLSDGYLANGAEPWRMPAIDSLPKFTFHHPKAGEIAEFHAYERTATLARPWAIPGVAGYEHRVGGLEKRDITGEVCYESDNHHHMCELRRRKVDLIADSIPPLQVNGDAKGELLVLGWGSTYGAITTAVDRCRRKGMSVSSAHLRHMDPMPKNTGEVVKSFRQVLIPEMNLGQLLPIIRGRHLVDAIGFNKVQGKPFMIHEIEGKIASMLGGNGRHAG
jgi:2-oxoglutarate ferredoxin oxidoreductase subunit alpha